MYPFEILFFKDGLTLEMASETMNRSSGSPIELN